MSVSSEEFTLQVSMGWCLGGKCYACLSVRTHPEVVRQLCRHLGLTPVLINALDAQGKRLQYNFNDNLKTDLTNLRAANLPHECVHGDHQEAGDHLPGGGQRGGERRAGEGAGDTGEVSQRLRPSLITRHFLARKIIELSRSQVENFAGNCYEVVGEDGRDKFIISTRGWASLLPGQRREIEKVAEVVLCKVDTIEKVGGGGIRCMMAGIFLSRK